MIARFREIKAELGALEALGTLSEIINVLFPDNTDGVRDLRALALNTLQITGEDDRAGFLSELSTAISKPEIPIGNP